MFEIAFAGKADHAVRVRAERREHERARPAQSPPRRERRAACTRRKRAVGVEEAELLREQPDEQDVRRQPIASMPPAKRATSTDDRERGETRRATRMRWRACRSRMRRRERGHHQVDADEPERLAHDLGRVAEHLAGRRRARCEHERDRYPHREQHRDRAQQPLRRGRRGTRCVPCPRRRSASRVTRLAKPPTKKKTGITWSTHVASHNHGTIPSTLPTWMLVVAARRRRPSASGRGRRRGSTRSAGSRRTGPVTQVWPARDRPPGRPPARCSPASAF